MNERPRENFKVQVNRGRWDEPVFSDGRYASSFSNIRPSSRKVKSQRYPSLPYFPSENVSKTSVKLQKSMKVVGPGDSSDPRFKRVITVQNDAMECASKGSKIFPQLSPTREETESAMRENRAGMKTVSRKETSDDGGLNDELTRLPDKPEDSEMSSDVLYYTAADVADLSLSKDHLQEVDKLKFNLDFSLPKRSLSESTLQTKDTSPRSEVDSDESLAPSSPKHVTKWTTKTLRPGRRRSLCTVLGQVPVSRSVMYGINQRRKIAKELDRHALIRTIEEYPENEERSNLVIQIKKQVNGKIYNFDEIRNHSLLRNEKNCNYYAKRNYKSEKDSGHACRGEGDLIPERDLSANHTFKRQPSRFKSRGTQKTDAEGKPSLACKILPSAKTFYVIIVLSGALYWFFVLEINPLELLCLKPKEKSWYEELLF